VTVTQPAFTKAVNVGHTVPLVNSSGISSIVVHFIIDSVVYWTNVYTLCLKNCTLFSEFHVDRVNNCLYCINCLVCYKVQELRSSYGKYQTATCIFNIFLWCISAKMSQSGFIIKSFVEMKPVLVVKHGNMRIFFTMNSH